jgi:hypothetical protein
MRWRSWIVPVLAVLSVAVSAALIAIAIDVLRLDSAVERDDLRFQARPTLPAGLWDDIGFLPGGIARKATGIDDDLRFRDSTWLFGRVQPGKVVVTGPDLEGLRGSAQAKLTEASRDETSTKRRARLLNLLGLLAMDRYTADPANRTTIIRNAVDTFQSAIEADPDLADAKFNLELVLRDFFAAIASGEETDRGAAQGRLGAAGRAGSGY